MSDAATSTAALPPMPLRPAASGVAGALTQAKGLLGQPAVRRAMPYLMGLLAVAAVAMLYFAVRTTDYRALFPNLPEDEYESILAVPILANRPQEKLEGALNVRTREPRSFTRWNGRCTASRTAASARPAHGGSAPNTRTSHSSRRTTRWPSSRWNSSC